MVECLLRTVRFNFVVRLYWFIQVFFMGFLGFFRVVPFIYGVVWFFMSSDFVCNGLYKV